MSDGRNRLRSLLDAAVTAAAIAATLLAVVVMVVLMWWLHSLSRNTPGEAAVANAPAPARQWAAPTSRNAPAPPPAVPAVQRVAAPAAPPPTAAPTAAPPTHGANDDAAKNRALGAALSRIGTDPELRRKLGLGSQVPP